jgi:heat shock protein HtpX
MSADPVPMNNASSASAHLFIINPFKGKGFQGWYTSLFSTHPPIVERVRILRNM